MSETTIHFEGHEGRECGEHRTVGYRAWCFDCSEWCYPESPCVRCETPKREEELEQLRAAVVYLESDARLVAAEQAISRLEALCARAEADDGSAFEDPMPLPGWVQLIRNAMHGPDSPADAHSPVSAATEATGGATEAQEG